MTQNMIIDIIKINKILKIKIKILYKYQYEFIWLFKYTSIILEEVANSE